MPKTTKFAILSDLHAPLTDLDAFGWALEKVREFEPDHIVINGDVHECDSASRWPSEYTWDQRDEYEFAATRLLDPLWEATPGATHTFVLGNHDANLMAIGRIPKKVRSLVHWSNSQWKDSYARWKQYPYKFKPEGTWRLGQVIVGHGWSGQEDLNAIKLNNMTGGYAHRLVVQGHTHTPTPVTQVMRTKRVGLPLWTANCGHLGPTSPLFMDRLDNSNWLHSIVLGECVPGRACQPTKNWDAIVLTRESSIERATGEVSFRSSAVGRFRQA